MRMHLVQWFTLCHSMLNVPPSDFCRNGCKILLLFGSLEALSCLTVLVRDSLIEGISKSSWKMELEDKFNMCNHLCSRKEHSSCKPARRSELALGCAPNLEEKARADKVATAPTHTVQLQSLLTLYFISHPSVVCDQGGSYSSTSACSKSHR